MNGELLCRWLDLPNQGWPPEPHILLGVSPDRLDPVQLEQLVQDRMAKLRCYQITHPEEATEGMNRLAQAFVTLSEAASRRNGESLQDTFVGKTTRVDWQSTPPPVRREGESEIVASTSSTDAPSADVPPSASPAAPARPEPLPPPPYATEPDPIHYHAQLCPEARRGLCSLERLLHRIEDTRRLLITWDRAGKYFRDPKRLLTRVAEEGDLTQRMERLFDMVEDYPKFIGQPGQPGYRVVALARLQMTAPMFKTMDAAQRKLLAKDWRDGRKLLLAHRRFLLQCLKSWRRIPRPLRGLQRALLTSWEHRYWVLGVAAALAAFTWALCLALRQ